MIEDKRFDICHRRNATHVLGPRMVAQDAGLQLIGVWPSAHQSIHGRCVQHFMYEIIGSLREVAQRRKERSVTRENYRLAAQFEFESVALGHRWVNDAQRADADIVMGEHQTLPKLVRDDELARIWSTFISDPRFYIEAIGLPAS